MAEIPNATRVCGIYRARKHMEKVKFGEIPSLFGHVYFDVRYPKSNVKWAIVR